MLSELLSAQYWNRRFRITNGAEILRELERMSVPPVFLGPRLPDLNERINTLYRGLYDEGSPEIVVLSLQESEDTIAQLPAFFQRALGEGFKQLVASDLLPLIKLGKARRSQAFGLEEELSHILEAILRDGWTNPYSGILEKAPSAQREIKEALTMTFQANLLWHIACLITKRTELAAQIALSIELLMLGNPLVGEITIPIGDEIEDLAPLIVTA